MIWREKTKNEENIINNPRNQLKRGTKREKINSTRVII